MYYICQICGRKYTGAGCIRCTQRSIKLSDFGQEALEPGVKAQDGECETSGNWPEPEEPGARLKMTGSGQLFLVRKPICRIGQDPSNDIVLRGDQGVARFHAQIVSEKDEYVLRDLGTRGGTALNGQRINIDSNLYDGDNVKIGSFKFYFISDLEV